MNPAIQPTISVLPTRRSSACHGELRVTGKLGRMCPHRFDIDPSFCMRSRLRIGRVAHALAHSGRIDVEDGEIAMHRDHTPAFMVDVSPRVVAQRLGYSLHQHFVLSLRQHIQRPHVRYEAWLTTRQGFATYTSECPTSCVPASRTPVTPSLARRGRTLHSGSAR